MRFERTRTISVKLGSIRFIRRGWRFALVAEIVVDDKTFRLLPGDTIDVHHQIDLSIKES